MRWQDWQWSLNMLTKRLKRALNVSCGTPQADRDQPNLDWPDALRVFYSGLHVDNSFLK